MDCASLRVVWACSSACARVVLAGRRSTGAGKRRGVVWCRGKASRVAASSVVDVGWRVRARRTGLCSLRGESTTRFVGESPLADRRHLDDAAARCGSALLLCVTRLWLAHARTPTRTAPLALIVARSSRPLRIPNVDVRTGAGRREGGWTGRAEHQGQGVLALLSLRGCGLTVPSSTPSDTLPRSSRPP